LIFAPAPYAAKTLVPKLVIKLVNKTNPNALAFPKKRGIQA